MAKSNLARRGLSDEDISYFHQLIDDLILLYEETNPAHGTKSEENKTQKSKDALKKIAILNHSLAFWAENHIAGMWRRAAKNGWKAVPHAETQKHENELEFLACPPYSPVREESFLKMERIAIGEILFYARRKGYKGWRDDLCESLHALNEGQVNPIVAPCKTAKKGKAYDLKELKEKAVYHVYMEWGIRGKKESAQEYVATACGVTLDAISDWEKTLIIECKALKQKLEALRRAAKELEKTATEDLIITGTLVASLPHSDGGGHTKDEHEQYIRDIYWSSPIILRLRTTDALNGLGPRLKRAGIRKKA
jgi:hypothetical protein